MTAERERPAAYIRSAFSDDTDLASHFDAVAEGARQRGWPPPQAYAEDPAWPRGTGPPWPAWRPRSRQAATTRC